ncbi:MAG: ABC transporter permease [Alphaproteobacteria bacterium GM202ARS2]|nr:ABC transporter permease [Alphaproteobacteria bacterium GM202ARS2]
MPPQHASAPLTHNVFFLRTMTLSAMLATWLICAHWAQVEHLPTPAEVFAAIIDQTQSGELFYHVTITLLRVLVSFFLALFIGAAIGIAMGRNQRINAALDDMLIIFLNIPALVVIILCYIWFGLNEVAAITAVAINKIPLVVTIMREAARTIDQKLIDVAQVYRLSTAKKLTKVYLPQLYPSFMAASRSGLSLIWKIVLVVELLGRSNGVGFKLHSYFQLFDIASILAYTSVFVAIVLIIDVAIIRPTEKYANRWRLT